MIELAIFASTFLSVFALGLQSLNVNQGHYVAAVVTSMLISTGHIALYKYMPDAQPAQLLAYYTGAIAGIVSSMWFHRRFKDWWVRWRGERQLRKKYAEHEQFLRPAIVRGYQPHPQSGTPSPPPGWPVPRLYDADSLMRGALRCAYWQCPYEARERSSYCGSHPNLSGSDTH